MFTSNIGRLRFFFYSCALTVAEIVAVVVCISATIGFEGLINSPPGPSRQGMAGAVLVVSLAIVLARGNVAWRRSRDANGAAWIFWAYFVLSAIYALLQAGTLLVIEFGNPESTPGGLNLLGLSIFGLWATILWAKPVAGSNIEELTSVFDFDGSVPAPTRAERMAMSAAAPATSRNAAPAARPAPAAQPLGRPRPAGFGKRGL
ncbi:MULTISPECIES: hypothetical protein [unclassified Mesorhizobium]|uniref:DUF805 domain-containing protein n=1 Tax=unclassified Mesorhizobium TaxID=325217 RepID=UPI000BB0A3E0|nr:MULTISPECIES: hypothetical protein [unclassified Mesorhizobium]AZO12698.1 hypothetical protein EJ074_28900 [Mesorhizobium sp. M3A.F.Ca.ET.080.04.2.1]PBB87173.1 hypothetical protein CK216_09450 [Mesorhizobium sp. WSM3876]RWB71330.1 MAG: hypothetical protein EOQ49_15550 [Mesorhizobium sp.]RWB91204.1 MAG: hypothetical protein EOQ52_07195 [Mesorhizobium sp.]RWE24353.1 MAG: hypothetical protein EOS41_16470 [Mesorhizobium sp.]